MFEVLANALPAVVNWFGAEQQNRRQADAAEAANTFSAQQFATRYQTSVSDMKSAGLNPMLAYSQGGGSPPSGVQANVPANSLASANSGYWAAQVAKAQVNNTEADTTVKRAQAMLTEAQIGATDASADQSRANIAFMEVQSKKIMEEVKNIPTEGKRLHAMIDNLIHTADLAREQGQSQAQVRANLEAITRKVAAETGLTLFDLKAAQDMGNLGREAGQLKPIFDILRSVLRR